MIVTPNGNSVVALPPSRDDLFCTVTLFGKRVFVWPVSEYERAVRVAEAFARYASHTRPFVVKIICLTAAETMDAMGIAPGELLQGQTPEQDVEWRQLALKACTDALTNSGDIQTRKDALQLLRDMGALQ